MTWPGTSSNTVPSTVSQYLLRIAPGLLPQTVDFTKTVGEQPEEGCELLSGHTQLKPLKTPQRSWQVDGWVLAGLCGPQEEPGTAVE